MEKVLMYLKLLVGLLPDQVEEEAEDILADFQEKVDRLQAVVSRHQLRLASIHEEMEDLQHMEQQALERQYRAKVLQDKLVDFIS